MTYSCTLQLLIVKQDSAKFQMWNSNTGEELAEFKGHTGPVFCCALAYTSNMVVSGSKDKTVKVGITSSNYNF